MLNYEIPLYRTISYNSSFHASKFSKISPPLLRFPILQASTRSIFALKLLDLQVPESTRRGVKCVMEARDSDALDAVLDEKIGQNGSTPECWHHPWRYGRLERIVGGEGGAGEGPVFVWGAGEIGRAFQETLNRSRVEWTL